MISIKSCSNNLRFFGEVEILCEILSRLPVKPLVRFKSVCRDWQCLIEKDLNFINLHLTHSKSSSSSNGISLLVYPLHNTVMAERMVLFSAQEEFDRVAIVPQCESSLLSCRNIIDTDFSIPAGVEMLKPVNGLICFHNHRSGSALIYNPSTRERTSWIKTNTEKNREEYLRLKREGKVEASETQARMSSYGFGFDPITRQHKVVCVNYISRLRTSVSDPALVVSCVREIICEVLTVGENKWRKIDEVPSLKVQFPAYVNGYIYWMGYHKSSFTQPEVILGFDVGSEKFNRVIQIPNFMLELWLFKVSTRLVYELVQVDGHLSIIDREGDTWINLWIYDDDPGNSNGNACDGNWIKETMPLPFVWDARGYLAFDHIPGTDIIVLKGFPKPIELECIYYYSRDKKEYFEKQVEFIITASSSSSCTRPPDRGYHVASFFQTLFPVQVKTW